MTPQMPLDQAMQVAAVAGGVEFWDWRGRDLGRLEDHARALDLPVVAFSGNTFDEPLVDARGRGRALEHFARSLDVARQLDTRVLVAHVGYAAPDRSRQSQWEDAVGGLREAGKMAEAVGVTLAVEPLNTSLDHPGYFLETLPDACRLIDEVDQPSVRLLLDIYHMRIMHADLLERLHSALAVTAHVHAADVPGRGEPGSGAIDWPEIVGALGDHSYRGWIGLEYWPNGDAAQAVRRSIEVLT
jgi:hydroxypyruvate isomerase